MSKLCHPSEISKALGISQRNVERYAKKLREQGIESFFNQTDHRGECYKMTDTLLIQAQQLLDGGNSQLNTAKTLGVSESCIRYHLKAGNFKIKINTNHRTLSSCNLGERNVVDLKHQKLLEQEYREWIQFQINYL